mgnify:CR=1 FL=1
MCIRDRINFIQVGIDYWGTIRAGHQGWHAHGGHGTGRKWPVVFAGILLDDPDMQNIYTVRPDVFLGEDQHTMYGNGWTGATALYAGHYGREGHPNYPDWGPYEHLYPTQWPGTIGESYRRCCTSIAWVGEATAIKIMQAQKIWGYPHFFDYVERWMTEDDTEHIQIINDAGKGDYSASYLRQRQAWDTFVEQMWHTYWFADLLSPNSPTNPQIIQVTDHSISLSWLASAQADDGDYAEYYI